MELSRVRLLAQHPAHVGPKAPTEGKRSGAIDGRCKNSAFLLVLMENCVIITSRCPAETAWGRPADEKAYSGMDGSSVRRCSLLPSCAQTLFENEISQNTKRGGRTRGRLFCWLEYSNRGGIEPQGRTISPEHGRAGRYSAVRRRRRPCRVFAWLFCRSKYRGLSIGTDGF